MFKVGQKVICIKSYETGRSYEGLVGKVLGFKGTIVGIQFDKRIGTHDSSACGTVGEMGHCWNFPIKDLEKYLKSIFADTEEVE